MDQDKASARLSRAYENAGGKNVGAISWLQVFEIIMSLLSGCTTRRAKLFAKRHPKAAEELLAGKLKDEASLKAADIPIVASAGVATFNATSANAVDELRDELDI